MKRLTPSEREILYTPDTSVSISDYAAPWNGEWWEVTVTPELLQVVGRDSTHVFVSGGYMCNDVFVHPSRFISRQFKRISA